MYVCICFGVTDSQVNAEIENGARSMREIAASCRAGTDCGRCVKAICGMIPRDESRRGRRERCAGDCAPRCPEHAVATVTDAPVDLPVPVLRVVTGSGSDIPAA